MSRNKPFVSFAAALACMAIALALASTTAHADDASATRCPSGYWLLEPVCINQSTGDVVNALAAAPSTVALASGCAPDYWRLGNLCLNLQTGDVELVDERQWPGEQSLGRR